MLKENGRLKPASKKELSKLKGKRMMCPKCSKYSIMANVEFAETLCDDCGTKLVDAEKPTAGKATGRK